MPSVVSVKEIWEDRDGDFAHPFARKYVRKFRVRTDTPAVGPIGVGFAAGLPKPYDPYTNFDGSEFDALALCLRISPVQQADDPCVWVVTCEYEIPDGQIDQTTLGDVGGGDGGAGGDGKPGGSGGGDKPENRPWKVSWGTETLTKAMAKSLDTNDLTKIGGPLNWTVPVANSAAQRFDPLPDKTHYYKTLVVVRYTTTYDPDVAQQFEGSLNDQAPWLIAKKRGQAQCTQWTAEQEYIGGRPFWVETIKIRFSPREWDHGWQTLLLDAGYEELQPTNDPNYGDNSKPPVKILDAHQQQMSEPRPLNGKGRALSPQDIKDGKLEYLKFNDCAYRDFDLLKLAKPNPKPPAT